MDHRQIGMRIRKLRKEQGYTQESFAEAVNLSPPYISCLERGKKKASLETIVRIASVLHITVDYLLTGTEAIGTAAFLPEMELLLMDCFPYERQIIVDIVETTKQSLKRNRWVT